MSLHNPLLALFLAPIFSLTCLLIPHKNKILKTKAATFFQWIGFFAVITFLITGKSYFNFKSNFIFINSLSYLFAGLIFLISSLVHSYSLSYLDGSAKLIRYYQKLSCLTFLVLSLTILNHLILFSCATFLANFVLTRLLNHRSDWSAANFSANYATKYFTAGFILMVLGFVLMTNKGHSNTFLDLYNNSQNYSLTFKMGFVCIILAACIQSAIFPLHSWLSNSLNCPTPISSFMHAGIVNGGGVLLVKLAPLYKMHPLFLNMILVLGSVSFILATFWKLVQSDVKKTLVYSTISQMGLMFMQCGLGLFSAAIAHSILHGLFKSYLFFKSGSAIADEASYENAERSIKVLLPSILIGGVSLIVFEKVAHLNFSYQSSYALLALFAFLATIQCSATIIDKNLSLTSVVYALFFSLLAALIYGLSIQILHKALPLQLSDLLLPLSFLHYFLGFVISVAWFTLNFVNLKKFKTSHLGMWIYMKILNSSLPNINASSMSKE